MAEQNIQSNKQAKKKGFNKAAGAQAPAVESNQPQMPKQPETLNLKK